MLRILKKKKFDIEAFIAGSLEGLQLVTASHKDAWRLGQEQAVRVDEENGKITFSFADGVSVSAPMQIVGIFSPPDMTFTWAWEHPFVSPKLQKHAARVKSFGEQYGAAELTTHKIASTEKRAWEYTALAMLLTEANGAYRVQAAPDTLVFMTFGELTILENG